MNKMERPIKAVIIDDEKIARETLTSMIEMYCPGVQIVGDADTVLSGQALIKEMKPELIFLDVEMPPGTGFDVLRGLDVIQAEVVFITAHDQYAIHAIRVSALDYLLKPVNKQELTEAVAKFQRRNVLLTPEVWDLLQQQLDSKKEQVERLVIPSLQGYEIIKVKDILYCEGDRNYTTFYFSGGETLLSSKTLKEYENLLPPSVFIRVHQKYLININFVKRYLKGRGGSLIMADGKSIDVSQNKKQALMDALG
jgi:two-component system, LytTR family, response regulator